MELKEITDIVDAGFKGIEGKVDGKITEQLEAAKIATLKAIEEKGYKTEAEVKSSIDAAVKGLEVEILAVKKAAKNVEAKGKSKSFKSYIGDGLLEAKESLKGLKSKSVSDVKVMLTKANEDLDPANFTGDSYEVATTERRGGLYETPYSPIWFRNLLPQGTMTGNTIQYIKELGNIGAAGVWDGTGAIASLDAKPGEAPTFVDVTKSAIWIAGVTRVKREMLDDISWLQSYLARQLTTGRKGMWVAENTQIYNALVADSVSYDGDKTNPIEILYDAAFGQLADNYYSNATILMNNRDVVQLIALNKAVGSGEYDLPPGSVTINNGQLILGGVRVIGAPNVPVGEYTVFDPSATEFLSRMSPEVRFFEQDRDNVSLNLVTVRAEERILPHVLDSNGVIHGTFPVAP